ncbi:MAG: hypothetical protein WKF65_17140 [Gaiellaceae bacterium]
MPWIGPFDSLDDVELLLTTDPVELPSFLVEVPNVDHYLTANDERNDG